MVINQLLLKDWAQQSGEYSRSAQPYTYTLEQRIQEQQEQLNKEKQPSVKDQNMSLVQGLKNGTEIAYALFSH